MIAQRAEDFATPLIDREYFFDVFIGDSGWNRVELNRLFDFMDKSERVLRTDEIAYILATIRWECGIPMMPIREETDPKRAPWLAGKRLPYMLGFDLDGQYHPNNGHLYFGRGYTQLTWYSNYKKFEALINKPIVSTPDLLLNQEVAWQVLEAGMYDGLYTGKKMSNFFYDNVSNFTKARTIINGFDHAEEIAMKANEFFYALRYVS